MTRHPQGILATCCVPWDEKEHLLEEMFRAAIARTIGDGFTQIYIFGTAGEGHAVDNARFREVATVFAEETRGEGILPQVGVIAQSTATYVEKIALAHDLGFRMFQISLPSWGRLNDAELLTFFRDVCGAFPECRFLHYNLGRAARLLQPVDYRRIADAVPNLVATKITGADLRGAMDLLALVPELQHFFVELYPAVCMHGECSLLAATAPMYPSKVRELYEHGRAGRLEALTQLHAKLSALDREIMAPVRGLGLMDGAYDKLRLRLGGMPEFPMRLLSPYASFSESQYEQCAQRAAQHREWMV